MSRAADMSEGITQIAMLKQAVAGVHDTGQQGFITCESHGTEGRYEVVAKFRTLGQAQAFYSSLVNLGAAYRGDVHV